MPTTQRMSIPDVDADAYKAVLGLEKYVHSGSLDEQLLSIVKTRASQINHCAWCLDMHIEEARKAGVEQRKLDLIAAWSEAGALFDGREQAALAFTEQVTLISQDGVTDDVWSAVRGVFDEKETLTLLMAIAAINVWNRMNVTARTDLPAQPATAG
ncbi:carboxymuconolactone decarboxylase family protein [Leekyejoonella antrihumi]|uniref:Carboxymuconolactone decarboxylase family protein n=1 Tax=Leekyejoonella antrihumi TaxID=1660198 RepID=A0A563DUD8_9MICO|nr:carboxymuconolactone decarboxylase family protein [Leekyejoonella antrihumi]TWP33532.1 carboxymuconolactone decarboxylase family protein [Leekyejoonella antrihumi]